MHYSTLTEAHLSRVVCYLKNYRHPLGGNHEQHARPAVTVAFVFCRIAPALNLNQKCTPGGKCRCTPLAAGRGEGHGSPRICCCGCRFLRVKRPLCFSTFFMRCSFSVLTFLRRSISQTWSCSPQFFQSSTRGRTLPMAHCVVHHITRKGFVT